MQAGVGLLVSDVMPIYMIIALDVFIIIRFSINCSTVICLPIANTYAILREATSETYGPQFYLLSYKFSIYFYLHVLFSNLYHKNTKNIYLILLSLSDLTFASGREGIDKPFIALIARFLFVCVGAWDSRMVSSWIDTLVLKN